MNRKPNTNLFLQSVFRVAIVLQSVVVGACGNVAAGDDDDNDDNDYDSECGAECDDDDGGGELIAEEICGKYGEYSLECVESKAKDELDSFIFDATDGLANLCDGASLQNPRVCFHLELTDYLVEYDLEPENIPESSSDIVGEKKKIARKSSLVIPLDAITKVGEFDLSEHLDSAYLGRVDEYYPDNTLTQALVDPLIAVTGDVGGEQYEQTHESVGYIQGAMAGEKTLEEPKTTFLRPETQTEAAAIIGSEPFKIWVENEFKYSGDDEPKGSAHVKLVYWIFFEVDYDDFEEICENARGE